MATMVTQCNEPPAYRDQTPTYHYAGPQSSPLYSNLPDASERVLQSTASSPTFDRTNLGQSLREEFIYKTDHMEVNAGSRVWGLRNPAYGLEGHIEGFVKLHGEQAHTLCVGARLHGDIAISTSNFGQLSGQESIRFLRQSITLYSSNRCPESSTSWEQEHRFSFALPAYVDIKGQRTPLPASFTSYLPGTYCEISYVLKIDMVRKGFLRRHETVRIPISYLPKSRPCHPPVIELPWPSGNTLGYPFHGDDRIRTEALSQYCHLKNQTMTLNTCKPQSIYLSLPSAPCVTSGEHIPFVLSLVFTHAPALPALLIPNIQIELIKRTRISRLSGVEIAVQEIAIGRADIRNIKEPVAGLTHLSGVIPASKPGRENSWKVYAMVDVQYIVRATVHPPKSMICNVPSWKIEMDVQLTTDLWGTLDHELIATDGIPTPALALSGATSRPMGCPTSMLLA